MCIIAVKTEDALLDDVAMDTLRRCWEENPHGAGFMFTDGVDVIIHKGYMSWRAFRRAVNRQRLAERGTVVFHFRIATQGVIDSETCHPFPVSDQVLDLKSRVIRTKAAVAHNGIISTMPEHDRYSDTQLFIRDVVSGASEDKAVKAMQKTGSKFALMTPDTLTLIGKFYDEADGWRYSNESYLDWEDWGYYSGYGTATKESDTPIDSDAPEDDEIDGFGGRYSTSDFPCMDCANDATPFSMFCDDCAEARGYKRDLDDLTA